MSEVFKGIDPALERHVAIKIMLSSTAQNNMTNFLEEARAIANLRHTNIVPLYTAGDEDGMPYIAMGFIEGETLEDWIIKGKILDTDRAMWFMTQAVAALDYAAKQNIIHLDVKPANFMVDADDILMLTDFGLARKLSELTAGLRADEELQGTPAYASPEHILQRQPDLRTDIYCLGASLFHLMTGKFPYPGDSTEEVCRKHIESNFPIDTLYDSGVPRGWAAMMRKMMEKRPEDRFQVYDEIAAALRNINHFQYGKKSLSLSTLNERRALPRTGGAPDNMFEMIPNEMAAQGEHTFTLGNPLEEGELFDTLEQRWPVLCLNNIVDDIKAIQKRNKEDIRELMTVLDKVKTFKRTLNVLSEFMAYITDERPQSDAEKIELIGIDRCSNLALLSIALQRPWQGDCPMNLQHYWHHCTYTGILAEFLVEMLGLETNGQEFFGSLIHDIGKLVMIELYPAKTMAVWMHSIEANIDLAEVEAHYMGIDHSQLGYEWLRRNKFPKQFCYLAAYHASPYDCYPALAASSSLKVFTGVNEAELTLLASVVSCANTIAKELGIGFSGNAVLDQTPWIDQQLTLDLYEARTKDIDLEELESFFMETCRDLPDLPILDLASSAEAEQRRKEAFQRKTGLR